MGRCAWRRVDLSASFANACQYTQAAHRMGRLRPWGHHLLPALFRVLRRQHLGPDQRALGLTKLEYLKAYDFAGHPLVNARCRFLIPTRFGDDVVIETAATEFRRSSFDVRHRLTKNDTLAVEGFETRVWVQGRPASGQMKAVPVPREVVERLSR